MTNASSSSLSLQDVWGQTLPAHEAAMMTYINHLAGKGKDVTIRAIVGLSNGSYQYAEVERLINQLKAKGFIQSTDTRGPRGNSPAWEILTICAPGV